MGHDMWKVEISFPDRLVPCIEPDLYLSRGAVLVVLYSNSLWIHEAHMARPSTFLPLQPLAMSEESGFCSIRAVVARQIPGTDLRRRIVCG